MTSNDANLRARAAAFFRSPYVAVSLERYGLHLRQVADEAALDEDWRDATRYRTEALRCLELAAGEEVQL